jgi:OOP family OmpA-OmpF porin
MASHHHRPGRPARAPFAASVLLVAVVAIATAGCADDISSGSTGGVATTAVSTETMTAAPSTATVDIADRAFSADTVTVAVGGTVTWVNSDTVDHEIVSLDSDVIRSPVLGQGGSYTALFTVPGEYPYYCNINNFMKGTVVVR